jgi:hypothetical protein
MANLISALSISRTVRERLNAGPFHGKALATFEDVCDLATPDGDVVAVVRACVGNGPLNVVTDVQAGSFSRLQPGARARLEPGLLEIGPLRVSLRGASVWEPCPDWDVLRTGRDTLAARLATIVACGSACAPPSSLMVLVAAAESEGALLRKATDRGVVQSAILSAAAAAAKALRAGFRGDATSLQAGAAGLAGLGGGLTPAGDDFLCGAMLCAWLAHPHPQALCQRLVATAAPRTTVLSGALLRATARGECSATWHQLLGALRTGGDADLATAVQEVVSHGATSGADALAGFLWTGGIQH